MSALIRYDAMCTAIAECHRVDEVKDMHDKAMALELYARQSKNTEAERRASEVRLRAERRAGELLKELARATAAEAGSAGGHAKAGTSNGVTCQTAYASALDRTGLSRQTANRYQALANVPQPVFEDALRDPVRKPTTTRILNEARDPSPKLDESALWIWGRARDFEREGFGDKDPAALLAGMTDTMRDDMLRIVPLMADFFNLFAEELEGTHEPA